VECASCAQARAATSAAASDQLGTVPSDRTPHPHHGLLRDPLVLACLKCVSGGPPNNKSTFGAIRWPQGVGLHINRTVGQREVIHADGRMPKKLKVGSTLFLRISECAIYPDAERVVALRAATFWRRYRRRRADSSNSRRDSCKNFGYRKQPPDGESFLREYAVYCESCVTHVVHRCPCGHASASLSSFMCVLRCNSVFYFKSVSPRCRRATERIERRPRARAGISSA